MRSTREQIGRLRRLKTPSLMLLAMGLLTCGKPPEKAQFKSCESTITRRDIVFIVDQSGTMYANDRLALRWEVLRVVAGSLFRDESLSAAQRRKNSGDTLLTQIAVIPFGGKKETDDYNAPPNPRWFTRNQLAELSTFLHRWKERSQKGDTAHFSNFASPFALLASNRLRWRHAAERYIFFISDGKYNILPHVGNPENHSREEVQFEALLTDFRRQKNWPVYFIGLGRRGLDKFQEPNFEINRIFRMAQALPLPVSRANLNAYPGFTAPDLLQRNLVTIITSNAKQPLEQLQTQLEHILRPVRSARPEPLTESGSDFPVVDPSWAEITVEVAKETTTAALVQSLRFFVKTTNPYKLMRDFKPLPANPGAEFFSSSLHTLVVDTAALRRELPEVFNLTALQAWGLKSVNPNIVLRRVGLAIKDNWKVSIERCEIVPQQLERSFWRRLLRKREPPRYQMELSVRATHTCKVKLPQALLRVRIPELGNWEVEGVPDDARTGTAYTWHFTLAHQDLFAQRIGWAINLELEIPDLYACSIHLPADIPLHAKARTSALMTSLLPRENPAN